MNFISYLSLLLIINLIILTLTLFEIQKKKRESLAEGKIVEVWEGKERRRYKRINADLPVRYEISINPKSSAKVISRDISEGGIGLIVYEKLKEGAPLRIWIDIPQRKEKFFVLGEVVWQKEVTKNINDRRIFFVGIRFTNVDILTQMQLFNFLSSLKHLKQDET